MAGSYTELPKTAGTEPLSPDKLALTTRSQARTNGKWIVISRELESLFCILDFHSWTARGKDRGQSLTDKNQRIIINALDMIGAEISGLPPQVRL